MEYLGVRIGQELIVVECVADGMVFDPFPFLALLGNALLFLDVVPELIISDYACIELLGVLNAIRIIVVLRRRLNYVTLGCQVVEQTHIIWHLGGLEFLDVHGTQFLLEVDFIVVEEVVRQKTHYLMTVLLPVL